jgi:HSP20 family protein
MNTELKTTQVPASQASARTWQRPHYDIVENEDAFNVQVRLPGVNRDGVDISLEEDTLTVVATRTDTIPESWRPLRRELQRGDYRLSLRLNVAVNDAEIKAQVADGVLDLSLPKADEVKPRKIKIS